MKIKLLTLALMSGIALAACSADDTDADMAATTPDPAMTDPATDPMATTPDPMTDDSMAAPGADMDIVANASNSPDHTTLVSAVQAAGLVETLQGPGPYTVFAPTNAAFDALPAGTVDGLLEPDSKDQLTGVLTYHVVEGSLDAAALTQQIEAGNGEARLTTVAGGELVAKANPAGGVTITDAQGNTANVTTADLRSSNGVIHVVDKVLMPAS
ncbi:fasciclin domain-containing protein [Lysobacter sp. 13A]|uniref:Fasciclin domain-containing protein n=2 Tax=Novilysobacter selenitireducens TaxID=2872639 RepID=A0ABS7T8I7_9GAMM|nr:fasciclin domain-containing protein [Lysobacter selenitireducens]